MTAMKRIFFIISVLASSLSLGAQELTILHINDTHSHIEPQRNGKYEGMGGVIEQAAFIDSVRVADGADNVLLLHAGDFSQGTSYFTELEGDIEVDILNAMSFDAVCLGNHEFDNGIDELARRIRNMDMPVVCANYDFSGTVLADLVRPYVIVERANHRVGIIGLLTDISVVVDADIAAVLEYQDPVAAADRFASELKADGCNLVMVLSHLGYEGDYCSDFDLAEASRNIDVIVGGHSHTFIENMGNARNLDGRRVVLVTDGKWGLEMGKLTVK